MKLSDTLNKGGSKPPRKFQIVKVCPKRNNDCCHNFW